MTPPPPPAGGPAPALAAPSALDGLIEDDDGEDVSDDELFEDSKV
jgi:hypothetical protein